MKRTSSTGISNYLKFLAAESKPAKEFVITGTDRNGKRFNPIYTNTPNYYNIYRGTVWKLLSSGKRKRFYQVFN